MFKSRLSIIQAALLCYAVPLFVISAYSLRWLPLSKAWNLMSLGLLFCVCGTIALIYLMEKWESELKQTTPINSEPVDEAPLPPQAQVIGFQDFNESQEKLAALMTELESKNQEMQMLRADNQKYKELVTDLQSELSSAKQMLEDHLHQSNASGEDAQNKIKSLELELDHKQKTLEDLEAKVIDLKYEIKTLVQLSEEEANESNPFETQTTEPMTLSEKAHQYHVDMPGMAEEPTPFPEKMVRNSQEAAVQLKRCVDIAQKITGASHYQNMDGRFQSLAVDNFALDFRHLFESLRSEHSAGILFYSQKERKLMFVNNQVKNLLGWSTDKVIQNFEELMQEGREDWKKMVGQASGLKGDTLVPLTFKTKAGSDVKVNVLLSSIPSGLFRNDVVGVLYING